MSALHKRIVRDGGTDTDLSVVGEVIGDGLDEVLIDPADLIDAVHLQVVALFHAIQDGLCLLLFWESVEGDRLILPLEGRGILDLKRFGGLTNPKGKDFSGRIKIRSVVKPGLEDSLRHFTLSLELNKQRS